MLSIFGQQKQQAARQAIKSSVPAVGCVRMPEGISNPHAVEAKNGRDPQEVPLS